MLLKVLNMLKMEIINNNIKTLMAEAREDKEAIKNKMIDIIMHIRKNLLSKSKRKKQEIRITLRIVK